LPDKYHPVDGNATSLAGDVELMPRQQECITRVQGCGEWRGGGQVRCCMGRNITPFLAYSTTFSVFTKIGGGEFLTVVDIIEINF